MKWGAMEKLRSTGFDSLGPARLNVVAVNSSAASASYLFWAEQNWDNKTGRWQSLASPPACKVLSVALTGCRLRIKCKNPPHS
jgi:hypothetical protein